MKQELPAAMRHLSDAQWLDLLCRSTRTPEIEGFTFPRFPSAELQANFVGSANESSLHEAATFYKFMKRAVARHDTPIHRGSRVLDFGCGWGRYLRFFMKDVDSVNLFGCDVSEEAIAICRETQVPGELSLIEPHGALPYADASFDVVMAYSVFTHLPEPIHVHWLKQIARVLRPGGMFCLTLEPRRFLDHIASFDSNSPSGWHRALARFKDQTPEYARRFDAGEFVYIPSHTGMEDTYGDAVVPLSYVERTWSQLFSVITYVDNPRRFWQAALAVSRHGGARPRWRLFG